MKLNKYINCLVVIFSTAAILMSVLPANAQQIKIESPQFGNKIDSQKLYREQLQDTLNGNVKKHVKGELVVKLRDKNQLNLFRQKLNQNVETKEIHENGTYLLKYTSSKVDSKSINATLDNDLKDELKSLSSNTLVETVELNVIENKSNFTPAINNFAKLWHHKNIGQTANPLPGYQYYMTSGVDIKTEAAWDITQGSASTVIAIIDASFDTSLPEFSGKIVNPYNFVDNSYNIDGPIAAKTNNSVNNGIWHGSSVAAIAAGKSNEVYGVCPECKIMPIKVLGESFDQVTGQYVEGYASVASVASALNYATLNKANVINMSFGGNFTFSPATQAAINNAYQKNITLVAAAGNENNSLENYPSDYNHVISVAALTANGYRAGYSNYGSKVAISAPVSIIGQQNATSNYVWIEGITSPTYMYNGQPKYSKNLHGTSFSSPMVTGAVGLMLSKNPNLTPNQVVSILKSTADTSIFATYPNQNVGKIGSGMLNVFEAVKAVDNNPMTNVGSLEDANCSEIKGWAYIPNQSKVSVEITMDDKVIASIQTNVPRPDIQNIIQVNGNYGFNLKTPAVAKNGLKHTVKAYSVNGLVKTQLSNSISINCNIQDFDKDNKSDVIWRNKKSGDNLAWNFKIKSPINDTLAVNYQWFAKVNDPDWEIATAVDFNMDGDLDILWRHKPSGGMLIWFMNGNGQITGSHWLAWVQDQNWQIAGVGDFDGDGQIDILWRNNVTGQNLVWTMKGLTINFKFLEWVQDPNWTIKAVSDFDGYGNTDILWINKLTKEALFWKMNKLTRMDYIFLNKDLFIYNTSKIEKIADFDGDNKVDILFRSNDGTVVIQYMVGSNNEIYAGEQRTQAVILDWDAK